MNKLRFTTHVLAIAILTLAFASVAQAQATRTWVSGVGDDANPCSRTAPCKTWAGAISKTAAGGEINALDPGGFGAVTIVKAITLDGGEGQIAGVLVTGTNGIVVQAGTGDNVTLRNMDIDGVNGLGLTGVQINSAKSVHIEHCNIYGFSQRAIGDNRTLSQNPAAQLFVNDCFIRGNASGIAITGSSPTATRAYIDHCHVESNSAFGVAASNGNFVSVAHSDITGNGGEGVRVDTTAGATVVGCIINVNLTGVLNNGGTLSLADTTIMNNQNGVSGTITTFGNNNVRSNSGGNTLPAPVGQQ